MSWERDSVQDARPTLAPPHLLGLVWRKPALHSPPRRKGYVRTGFWMGPPQGKRGPGPGWARLRGKGPRVLDGPASGLARLALEDEEGVALLLHCPRHLVLDLPGGRVSDTPGRVLDTPGRVSDIPG